MKGVELGMIGKTNGAESKKFSGNKGRERKEIGRAKLGN